MSTSQFTNEQIAQYLANQFNLPSSSSQDLLSRVVSDYQSGNIETGQKVLADAAKYQVSDQQLASVFGVTPAQIQEFRGVLPTTNTSALSTTPASTSGALSNQPTSVDGNASSAIEALSNQVTSTPVGGDKATPTGALPTTDLTTQAIDTSEALSTVAPTVSTAVDLNRSNTIRDAFLSIYDDPSKTSYEKAQEIKALAATSKVDPTEIANALGFTGQDGVALLNTFLDQPDSTTLAIRNAFAGVYNDKNLTSYEKAQQINRLAATNKVGREQIATALNIDKKDLDSFLDQPDPTTRAIQTSFAGIYNNKDLTDAQKARQINQLAATNKISRDQIATALGVTSANLNTYLDQDPTVISNLLQTANTKIAYNDPKYTTQKQDYEGNWYSVLNAAGQQLKQEIQEAERRLEALGYEAFDPDGPSYQTDFGTEGSQPAKWLSPEEAANVTGTKINNQLRNLAYVQNTDYLAPSLSPLANQMRQSLDAVNSSGGMLLNHPAYFYNKIAEEFTSKTGITNLDDVGYRKFEGRWIDLGGDPPVSYFIRSGSDQIELSDGEYFNKKTGNAIGPYLPNFKHGIRDDETAAHFTLGPDGKPKLTTYYAHEEPGWKEAIVPLAIITAPFTVGSSLAALGGAEVAGSALASELAAADIALGGLGGSAGAASLTAGALPTIGSITSAITSQLPAELVQAGQTLYNSFNTVKPYLQAANSVYQLSQGNIANALLSGIDTAGSFGVSGAKELGQALNVGLAASKGNYFPALQFALNQTGIGGELANTKIAGDFTIGDAVKGATFVQAASSGDPTQILNAAASLTNSQDLKVAAAANNFVNILNNPNATAFDIAMSANRVAGALNTASKQPPPKGSLPTSGQSTVTGALGTDTTSGAAGRDVVDEYNVTGGAGTQITDNTGANAFIAAKNVGATDSEALSAANQVTVGTVKPSNVVSRDTSYDPDLVDATAGQALATKIADAKEAIRMGAGESTGTAEITAGAGEFTGADTARAVNEKIAGAKTFGEAYSEARNAFGAGATFNWQGKLYSTDTFQENPALGLVPVAGSGRGQAAGKTAEQEAALLATAEELKRIDPAARAALLDPASINYSEMSPESNAQGLTQTAADRLVQSVMPVDTIKTVFGMTTEAAGNTIKAFGTIGESLGLNTAQMSDYGRRLENIAQELYPQALKTSEDEVKSRFANAKTGSDLYNAIKDSFINNPGAVAKMIGVEGLQEVPNILLAVSTGGASAVLRYGGLLAGLGLDVVESAGLQGAQKVDEGLAKGLTRAQAVKSAVDDMKAAGAVTAVMTAAADKIPFGGTVAKTLIKGSAGEGIEEYVIARATGQDHMSALRQAAFGAMIGGPTEASLQGAGNLTNVTINGDTMIGTYEDGTKVSISEPAGATDLKIDIIKPTDTSVNVSNTLTADLSSGADLSTSINNVVSNNITADLSGTIDSTVKAVIDNGAELSQGVTDLTSSAVSNTGDATAVINNVVSSLASNGTDLNANAGSVVAGAVSGGATVTDAVDTTLKAVTANGGSVADSAASIVTTVSTQSGGDTTKVTDATASVVDAAIASGTNVTTTTSNAVDAALAASGGSTDVVTQVVGGVASKGNNDATAAAVASAVTNTGNTTAAVDAALSSGGDAGTVLSTASNAAVTAGTDAGTAVTNTLSSALSNNVDTKVAVDSTIKGALDAGANSTSVIDATITTIAQSGGDVSQAAGFAVGASLAAGADTSQTLIGAVSTAIANGGDASTVVTNVVNSAVTNGTSLADASASSIATAIVSGANADTVIKAVTDSNSGLAVESGTDGGVTTVVASDGTSNTQVSMDANTQTVTTTTTDTKTGETKQVTMQGDTTTQITSNANTGVVTQIVSNPDRDQIVTTTWNPDNTVTVTTKSGDSAGTTETLTADTAPVKPKLDPIAAVVPVKTTQAAKTATTTPKASFNLPGAAAGLGLSLPIAKSDYDLGVLKSSGDTTLKNPLEALMERVEQMNQVDPTLAAVMSQRLGIQQPQMPTYTYGQESSIEDILGLREPKAPEVKEEFMAYAEGGYVEPLRAKGGAMNLQFMDRGGALPGGREDFKGGKHVAGDGDGQSDDIPAWLADSEFVLPADVVAALGNGSTKAGTNKLYEMMYAIRKRARSTGPKDLPPPAYKSPLDYIKKSAKR